MSDPIQTVLNVIRDLDEKKYEAIAKYQESRTFDSLSQVFSAFQQYLNPTSVNYFKYLFDFLPPKAIRLASLIINGSHYFVILEDGDLYLQW